MEKPQYIDWIVEETGIVIKDDIPLKCYKIDYKDDESILDDWALHIRRNYIEDTELKEDADDNAMTVEQSYISQVENGKTVPTPMFIKLFCLTFSVNEEQFHEK